MSLSPPFVISMAVSTTGVVAAGTADGRLLIGFGAERGALGKGKKAKKWEGLNPDETLLIKIAEGPIVALYASFCRSNELIRNFVLELLLSRDVLLLQR